MGNNLNIKHKKIEDIALASLVDVIYQAKYLLSATTGFRGLFKFSLLSWNYHSSLREINLFYRSYLNAKDILADYAIKQNNRELQDYILRMLKQFPTLPFFPRKISFANFLLITGCIVFFPLLLLVLFRDIKRVEQLHRFLDHIISISQSILKVSKNNSWLEVIGTHERLN